MTRVPQSVYQFTDGGGRKIAGWLRYPLTRYRQRVASLIPLPLPENGDQKGPNDNQVCAECDVQHRTDSLKADELTTNKPQTIRKVTIGHGISYGDWRPPSLCTTTTAFVVSNGLVLRHRPLHDQL